MTDEKRPDDPAINEPTLRKTLTEATERAQDALKEAKASAQDTIARAVYADVATAPPDRKGLSATSKALIECMAEVNEGHARAADALKATRDAIDGKDVDLETPARRLCEQRDAIDDALSQLPENRTYLDAAGKRRIRDLDESGKRGLYVHLRRRLLDAVAEGFCKDRGVASVDDLSEEDRAELRRRQDTEAAKW